MSKSFKEYGKQRSKKYFASEVRHDPGEAEVEARRQYAENWDADFVNPDVYIKSKLRMLRKDMYIEPTPKEVAHLKSLKTRGDIDRAVHSIIERHWGDE